MDRPYEGFFMDKVYRVFQKGEDPKSGKTADQMKLKSIITQPLADESLPAGRITILGAAYAGEERVSGVDVSVDGGRTWHEASLTGPDEPYAWRQWRFLWRFDRPGDYTIMARARDTGGREQPMTASWNVQGYFNNGVSEHAIRFSVG